MPNILKVGVSEVSVFLSCALVRSKIPLIRAFYDAIDCNDVRIGVAGNKMTTAPTSYRSIHTSGVSRDLYSLEEQIVVRRS
jgi:hypothetical protein